MQHGDFKNRKKRTRFICLALAVAFLSGCTEAKTTEPVPKTDPEISSDSVFTDNKNGTVSFSYNNTNKEKCKVVTKLEGGKMYQYEIPSGRCDLVFPLSQGNGSYQIYLCKNTTGNKYSIVESVNISLDLKDDLGVFLVSNYVIDWNTENEAIKQAYKLTEGLDSDEAKIEAIYEYMVKNFSYDYEKMDRVQQGTNDKIYVPDINDTYATKMGICYDLSVLTASMLRSVAIPAKVVTGYTSNTVSYHAWNNVYYRPSKEWRTVDVTYDIMMHKEGKKYYIFKKDEYYSNVMYMY